MASVEYLRGFVNERLTAAAEEIFGVFQKTIIEYEEKINHQRKLLDVVWEPKINLQNTELLQQQIFKEEEEVEVEEGKVLADQQLCIQERTSSLDPQDLEPPQIKEEQEELCTSQEGEQLEVKQETDSFLFAPYEESDHSGDQILSFGTYGAEIVVEENPLSDISYMNSVVLEANTDHQLLSHNLQEAESQDQKGGWHGDSGSARNAVPKCKKRLHKSRRHTNNVNNPKRDSEIPGNTQTSKRPFKCDTCGKDFKFKSFFVRHQSVHTVQNRCICNVCGRKLYDTSALKKHIRIHTGEKPYNCKVCGRDFRYSGGLEVHMRIHRDEKPFVCNTCGKCFRCLSVLNAHLKIHTGEKPYVCKTCNKGFSEMSALKRHMRSHTGEKPYSCKICGSDFRYSSGFQAHMKRAHTGELNML
ncbi:zinc finger protein 514-like [Centropristis striata]|uniref:zinc finger protein 514-like n=1 Tax=Centropristis striata TaxID=184440 RepID=UPI0027E16C68|nr:zinc finger protein 514-like [Centropristis striata]